jgi:hypothetical protein
VAFGGASFVGFPGCFTYEASAAASRSNFTPCQRTTNGSTCGSGTLFVSHCDHRRSLKPITQFPKRVDSNA